MHLTNVLLLTANDRINIDRKEISPEIWGKIGESITGDCPDVIQSLSRTRIPPYVVSTRIFQEFEVKVQTFLIDR